MSQAKKAKEGIREDPGPELEAILRQAGIRVNLSFFSLPAATVSNGLESGGLGLSAPSSPRMVSCSQSQSHIPVVSFALAATENRAYDGPTALRGRPGAAILHIGELRRTRLSQVMENARDEIRSADGNEVETMDISRDGKRTHNEGTLETIPISEAITEWFGQAERQCMEAASHDLRFAVSLSAVLLAIGKTYCRASACLLDNGFRLPAAALLRVVAEVFVKFLWCVDTDDDNETKTRLYRWEKSTGKEKVRLLDQLTKAPHLLDNSQVAQLKKLREDTEAYLREMPRDLKHMPKVTGPGGLFEQTSKVFGLNVSAFLYGQFCPAVHIDTSTLGGVFRNVGGNLIIADDAGDEAMLKVKCLTVAYMFVVVFRETLGLDRKVLDQQFAKVVKRLGAKEGTL